GGASPVSLDNPGGGTVALQPGLNCVRNDTSVVQEVLDIDRGSLPGNAGGNSYCYETPPQGGGLADECMVGTRLQPTLACFVWAGLPPFQGGNNGGFQESDLRLKAD